MSPVKQGQKDPSIVNFRNVVNDAHVHPWEHMPEVQPPTVTALIAYLKICNWDPEALRPEGWRGDGYVLRYGMRKQFWLPKHPTDVEQELLESFTKEPESVQCPFCTKPMDFETTTPGLIGAEENHVLVCRPCNVQISRFRGHAWTPNQIAAVVRGAYDKPKAEQG